MIFLILLVSLFFVPPVFASPQILINNYPSSLNPDSTFPVSFLVTNAGIGSTYYYKFFGGIGESTSAIKTNSSLSYNSAWINFPVFIADLGGSAQINTNAYLISEAISTVYNFKVKIALTTNTSTGATSPNYSLNVVLPEPSSIPSPTPTIEVIPTLIPTPEVIPTTIVNPTPIINNLIVSEIMANPETNQDEWIEIYNPKNYSVSLKDLCFFDASNHSRCFPDEATIAPNSYYSHSFSSGFLNNKGDTVTFQNISITYSESPKNFSYSRQENDTWCFADPSQNLPNLPCSNIIDYDSTPENKYPSPLLSLQFIPDSVTAGDDFNLVFNLKSNEQFSLRIISPFGSSYFPFNNFHDGYSWLTMPLSVPKKTPEGTYPLSFHLKKAGSSHLYDYQLGNLNIKSAPIVSKKSKVLGVSTVTCPLCPDNSASVNYLPASTLRQVPPDYNFFSWPFLFVGSILFLSPIIFPKLYSA